MPQRTVLQDLCDTRLGEPVEIWAHKRYDVLQSWRAVAHDLSDLIGREVSRQSLLDWVRVTPAKSKRRAS